MTKPTPSSLLVAVHEDAEPDPVAQASKVDLDELGTPELISRRIYHDEAIYELEQERIWRSTWVPIGLEPEVANPGDFVTKTINGVPLLVVRSKSGEVKVLENTCAHRGSMVEARRCGNARRFACPYHGWTFDTEGQLVGVPNVDGLDDPHFSKAEHPLRGYPRVETFAGLIFATYNLDAPPVAEHLGEIGPVITTILRDGAFEILGSSTSIVSSNWKVFFENATDSYHGTFLHKGFSAARTYAGEGIVKGFDGGHGLVQWIGQPIDQDAFAARTGYRLEYPEVFQHRVADPLDPHRGATVFPNLIVTNHFDCFNIILIEPNGVDECRITRVALADVRDTPEQRAMRAEQMAHTFLAGGIQLIDDVIEANWVQRGLRGRDETHVDLSRGLDRDEEQFDSEEAQRNFYRQWLTLMRREAR